MSILSQQKQSVNTDFPNLRPSLDLRFALAKKLDPRITFTRGSTGTYFGPDGIMRTAGVNEPRFDHDPVTGQSLGLLVEESRQNLLTYSDDFGDASWFKGDGSVSTNLITAPDGNTTADAFIENTLSNKFHYINKTLSKSASSTVYTASCWLKDKGRQVLMNIQSGGSNGVVCRFNPATGQMIVSPTAFGTGWTAGSFSVVPYPNGWYRVSMTATSDTLTTVVFQLATYNTSVASNTYTGDGTSGIYIWGAQLEAGSFPTSYIPTTASTVTRSADVASMTGTNFSSWYNSSEGTIQTNVSGISSTGVLFNFHDGTVNNRIIGQVSGGITPQWWFIINGVSQFSISQSGAISLKSSFKYCSSYASNNFSGCVNGGSLQTRKSLIIPTVNSLSIGQNVVNATHINGTISRLTYYPIQLTNQQLINLTS